MGRRGQVPGASGLSVVVMVVAVAVLSTTGVLFAQRSYRGGLGAPLGVSNIADPAAATRIAVKFLRLTLDA